MDIDSLLHLFSSSGQKIDALWQFYVTVHIAVFGGLFVFHRMYRHQIFIIIISYIAFSLINLRAKIFEYEFYNAVLDDLKLDSSSLGVNINNFFEIYTLEDRLLVTLVVHIFSFVFLIFIIWQAKIIKSSDSL